MNALRHSFVAAIALALAGCFSSEEPLIGPEQAVFPYETIVFTETGGSEETILTRQGDAYIFRPAEADSDGLLRVMPVDELYVAQLAFEQDGDTNLLYAILKVDFEAKTAQSYAAVASADFSRPGFTPCSDASCIDDVRAYVDYGRELIAAGHPPDAEYTIISAE